MGYHLQNGLVAGIHKHTQGQAKHMPLFIHTCTPSTFLVEISEQMVSLVKADGPLIESRTSKVQPAFRTVTKLLPTHKLLKGTCHCTSLEHLMRGHGDGVLAHRWSVGSRVTLM